MVCADTIRAPQSLHTLCIYAVRCGVAPSRFTAPRGAIRKFATAAAAANPFWGGDQGGHRTQHLWAGLQKYSVKIFLASAVLAAALLDWVVSHEPSALYDCARSHRRASRNGHTRHDGRALHIWLRAYGGLTTPPEKHNDRLRTLRKLVVRLRDHGRRVIV